MSTREVKELAWTLIQNNEISPLNPYTIHVRSGTFPHTVDLYLIQTSGLERPQRRPSKPWVKTVKIWQQCYLGLTRNSNFYKTLPIVLQHRDFLNMLHRVKLKKQPISVEMMQSVTDPEWKRQLIEAACLAAI